MILEGHPIVPVVVVDDAANVAALVDALSAGGIRCAEITLRTPAAVQALRIAGAVDGFVAGAGTVLTPDDVDRVVDAGARFVVSPGLDDDVVARCRHHGVDVVPGVATATEVQRALRLGLDRLKFFPAAQLGGLATIEALRGPFPGGRFLPSGGVSPENAAAYTASPAVFAVSGSWMATRAMIRDADFATIERVSREAVALVTP